MIWGYPDCEKPPWDRWRPGLKWLSDWENSYHAMPSGWFAARTSHRILSPMPGHIWSEGLYVLVGHNYNYMDISKQVVDPWFWFRSTCLDGSRFFCTFAALAIWLAGDAPADSWILIRYLALQTWEQHQTSPSNFLRTLFVLDAYPGTIWEAFCEAPFAGPGDRSKHRDGFSTWVITYPILSGNAINIINQSWPW